MGLKASKELANSIFPQSPACHISSQFLKNRNLRCVFVMENSL
jgi:hypothetical protein